MNFALQISIGGGMPLMVCRIAAPHGSATYTGARRTALHHHEAAMKVEKLRACGRSIRRYLEILIGNAPSDVLGGRSPLQLRCSNAHGVALLPIARRA